MHVDRPCRLARVNLSVISFQVPLCGFVLSFDSNPFLLFLLKLRFRTESLLTAFDGQASTQYSSPGVEKLTRLSMSLTDIDDDDDDAAGTILGQPFPRARPTQHRRSRHLIAPRTRA